MLDNYNEILTIEEAMEFLCTGKNTMYELLRKKKLQHLKLALGGK